MKPTHALVVTFASIFVQQAYATTQYQLTPIPSDPSSTAANALAVNQSSIVGSESFNIDQSLEIPLVWQTNTLTPAILPTGDKTNGLARAQNINNQIVGETWNIGDPSVTPVSWNAGQLQPLPTLNMGYGNAYAINNQGLIVGEINNGGDATTYQSKAVLWSNGTATLLGNFPGAQAYATAINNNAQALVIASYANHAETWIASNGAITQITATGVQSIAGYAINDNGDVVGIDQMNLDSDDAYNAFLLHDGTFTQLPKLDSDIYTIAQDINNNGQIVGEGSTTLDDQHAILWENNTVFDLNTLIPSNSGWFLQYAQSISDDGSIVGMGTFNHQNEPFLLTPNSTGFTITPEPTTLSLLTLAALPLLTRRRRH